MQDTILVFCRDRQQASLMTRTLRYREFFCLPVDFETTAQQVQALAPKGLMIAGNGVDALEGLDFELFQLNIPVLVLGEQIQAADLGTRKTFADIAATVADLLNVPFSTPGTSFAKEIL